MNNSMKLLHCSRCNELVQLRNELRCCPCGSQIGQYLEDDLTVKIASKYLDDAKLIGVSNLFLRDGFEHDPVPDGGFFAKQNSNITVIPFDQNAGDVVYGDWDEMREEWLAMARKELFDPYALCDVFRCKSFAADHSFGDMWYELSHDVAKKHGYTPAHVIKLCHLLCDGNEMVDVLRSTALIGPRHTVRETTYFPEDYSVQYGTCK